MRSICKILIAVLVLSLAMPLAGENDTTVVKRGKPVFADVFVFAEGGFPLCSWWKKGEFNCYMPTEDAGCGVGLYSNRDWQFRLYAGYEFAPLTDFKSGGYIGSHWFTLDFNARYKGLFVGAKGQAFLGMNEQGTLPHEMLGLNKECFNKVACKAYVGVSFFNVEISMGFYVVPLLSEKQLELYKAESEKFYYLMTYTLRYNFPVFTTGRRSDVLY